MKAWILRHWLVSFTSMFLLGAGAGGGLAATTTEAPKLERRIAALTADLTESQDDLVDAEEATELAEEEGEELAGEVASLQERLAAIDAEWERLRARTNELARVRETLDGRAARVDAATRRVGELERELRAELHRVRNSTISEGTWEIGVDVEPGVYRARGGSLCYWAILNSLDNFDIANNGGFTANQTVQLTSGWFESHDCGEWKKIG